MSDPKNPRLLNAKEVERFRARIQAEAERLFGRMDIRRGGYRGDPPWLDVIVVDNTRYELPPFMQVRRTFAHEKEMTEADFADEKRSVMLNLSVAFREWERWQKMDAERQRQKHLKVGHCGYCDLPLKPTDDGRNMCPKCKSKYCPKCHYNVGVYPESCPNCRLKFTDAPKKVESNRQFGDRGDR